MKRIKPIVFTGFLIMIISSCNFKKKNDHKDETTGYCLNKNFKQKIEIQQATKKQLTEVIPLTGSVEPNPDKVVHFVSLAGGIISNTHFSLGDKVSKGQILAELHSTELSSLQSQLQTINSQIGVAQKKLQSVQSMFDDGISSQKDLMEAQSELVILTSEKRRINSHLTLFNASTGKGVFQIKAPASGIITKKSISSGSQISEGEPLFTVSDLREVWIMVNVYATNVQNIQAGMEVSITTLSYPDEKFNGKIAAISQVYDQEARVLKARVVMQNNGLRFKPGMLVDVTAMKQQNIEVVAIPTDAMVFDDDQNFAVVYKDDCDIQIRKVEILSKNNGITYIASGLDENEKIISKNQLLIYEQIKNFQQ